MKRVTGHDEKTTVAGEEVSAFVPFSLPPKNPKFTMTTQCEKLLQKAKINLQQLEVVKDIIPSLDWFIYSFVRKEAVTSSQIEGTQATLVDLLTFESNSKPSKDNPDIEEVCNYLDAIKYAREQLNNKKGLPLSMRLLNNTHKRLMTGSRGKNKQPGQIRTSQNWIGGTRPGNAVFVPTPPHKLNKLLSDFEKYIHSHDKIHPLIKTGLLHVQFETIHPYLDGNGRIGRLLITLLLEHWHLISEPLLYLSVFLKKHRQEYYRQLENVRLNGDFEGWILFFLEGIITIAEESMALAKNLSNLVANDRKTVLSQTKTSAFTMRLFEQLPLHPIMTMSLALNLLNTTKPTALKAISSLEETKILSEISGKKKDRVYAYTDYLDLLKIGTEL
ncbi:Fic family protein [bacterium]|nr:Fic family protein [bacterium]